MTAAVKKSKITKKELFRAYNKWYWLLGKGDDEIMHEMCILLFYNNYLCVIT